MANGKIYKIISQTNNLINKIGKFGLVLAFIY